MGGLVSGIGDVVTGANTSKGAAQAAQIEANTAAANEAQLQGMYNDAVTRYTPQINAGNSAGTLYNDAIGNGTDPNAATTALNAFQSSSGYNTQLTNALNATNASAYASGMGKSGAAEQALQTNASNLAQQSYNSWLGNLNTSVQTGSNAMAALTGVQGNAVNGENTQATNSANAQANAIATSTNGWNSAISGLTSPGMTQQSSYGGSSLASLLGLGSSSASSALGALL